MNRIMRTFLVFFIFFNSFNSYTSFSTDQANWPENTLLREKNLYFSNHSILEFKGTRIIENDRDYFLSVIDSLGVGKPHLNHLFVKVFCIYKNQEDQSHYIDSPVMAKFNDPQSLENMNNFGLTVKKYRPPYRKYQTSLKRLINFKSGGANMLKKTSINDFEEEIFCLKGRRNNHSEKRFFFAEENSTIILGEKHLSSFNREDREVHEGPYANSIFTDLIIKNNLENSLKEIEAFGVKFFSRFDSCDECQVEIWKSFFSDTELYSGIEDTMQDLSQRMLYLTHKEGNFIPLIPIYYATCPYAESSYSIYDENRALIPLCYKYHKGTHQGSFQDLTSEIKIFPKQKGDDLDLSQYVQHMFSNIRTLYSSNL